MNKEIEKVLGELKSIIRKLNGVAYGKEYMIPHEHNLFNKIRQHITNQEEEIEKLSYTNQVKTIVELTVENSIIQSKLDKIKEVVSRSRVEEITSSVDTGFNVYHSSDKYYVIRKSTIDKILEEKWWKKKKR